VITILAHEGTYFLVFGSQPNADGSVQPLTATMGEEGALALFLGLQQALVKELGEEGFAHVCTVIQPPGKEPTAYPTPYWCEAIKAARAEHGAELTHENTRSVLTRDP
jgi:hypothetical protein